MPKKPDPRRIKKHLIYTPAEAAAALGVHKQTVQRWIKDGNLPADRSQRPWLIEGEDLKAFLEARRKEGKCKTGPDEIYCLPCRRPQVPDGRIADFHLKTSGEAQLIGLCPVCGRLMHKVVRRAALETIQACLEVTIQPVQPRIVGEAEPPVNVTFAKESYDHVKKRTL